RPDRRAVVLRTPDAQPVFRIEECVGVFLHGPADLWVPGVLVKGGQVEEKCQLMPGTGVEGCVIADHLGPRLGLLAGGGGFVPRLLAMPGLEILRVAGLACQVAEVVSPVSDDVLVTLVAGEVVGEGGGFQSAVIGSPELRLSAQPCLGVVVM